MPKEPPSWAVTLNIHCTGRSVADDMYYGGFHCICDDGCLVKVVYPLEDSLPSNARIDARTRLVRRRSGGALSRRGPIMPLHSYGLLVGKIVGFREPRGH